MNIKPFGFGSFGDFFTLGAPVGPGQPNRREDVLKVESILGNTGHHDLARTGGPLGFWGEGHEKAVKAWQGEKGLKVDGLLKPNGPTITSLKQATGGLLGGFKPPSPGEVDEHHARQDRGEPGLLNTRPARLSIRVPDKAPELDEQTLAFNADTAGALTRTSVDGDVPRMYANYLKQAGADARTTVLDLVDQVNNSEGRDRAERLLHGILGQLLPDQAKAVLGGDMPAPRAVGVRVADLADDDAVPLFSRAAEVTVEVPKPVQLAQAKLEPEPEQEPAPRPESDTDRRLGKPMPTDDSRKETRATLEKVRDRGKALGQRKAGELLGHYLDGDGSPVTLDKDWVRGHPPVKQAEDRVQGHFENWLKGDGPRDKDFLTIANNIPKDGETREIKGLNWDATADSDSWRALDERNNALGGMTVKGVGDLKLERRGDEVIVTGTVRQNLMDRYDFGKPDPKTGEPRDGWLPQGTLGGNPFLSRLDIVELEKHGMVKPFEVRSDPWEKRVVGRLKLDPQGRIIGSEFEWKE